MAGHAIRRFILFQGTDLAFLQQIPPQQDRPAGRQAQG